ncbi:unannotated protein [freshwater metagenome]|uniref:Unannotated protein n=1 Tax=freshwater metagenome TaxID=449393 RepID=A0A6J7XRB0_9ZZZZ|nr:amino acid permease [Actinomycetota bacterium]
MKRKREVKASTALIRERRTLSTQRVVFLVIAAAAPMAAMIGNVPLALVYGNGAGLPSAFLIASIVLICFSVGYAAMSRRVINTGAFYTYIARSLSKPVGVGAAYVALVSYTALACGLAGAFGYFMRELVIAAASISIPWFYFSALSIVIVAILGYRSVDLSSKVLGILMIAEFAILIIFEIIVISKNGISTFPLASFTPSQVTSAPIGIALLFAFTSFIGFESAALYGEETKDPEKSIPRATYIAVLAVGIFYVLTTWIIIGSVGADKVISLANRDGGLFVLNLVNQYGGEILFDITAVLLCTSVLAGYSAIHNASSRYLFALGREAIAPRLFGTYHGDFFSPHIASIAVSITASLATIGFALSGADPYKVFAASLIGLGTLGIVALQATASLSVLAFFRKRNDRKIWQGVIAPLVGFIGLTSAFVLAVIHYKILTGSDNSIVNAVPLVLLVVALLGIGFGFYLKQSKPVVYAKLASTQLRGRKSSAVIREKISYSSKYCLVGAGPSGLIMARALTAEGVPFDWFERHSDLGGIWDIENPGSPMYESAHFISSKYTSGFYGFPMPQHFPDYPSWRQILEYIRNFADTYQLKNLIIFNTSINKATPLPEDKWEVHLSSGVVKIYDGFINATGTNWHASAPTLKGSEKFGGKIIHSVDFHSGDNLHNHRTLVVGAGNSGVDIACEAARFSSQAFLSVRRGYRFIPKHIFGLPTDALLSGKIAPPKGVSITGDANKLVDTLVGDLTRLGLPAPDHDVLQSHPIMNTQVLYHLAHGDLIAKPDVQELTQSGVIFTDGSYEDIDRIILATGYQYLTPFLEAPELDWSNGRPDLYLRIFSRAYDSLYFIGYIELADAAYKRFDEQAQLIVMNIHARESGLHKAEWRTLKNNDNPDLSGGHTYINSPRHTNYVEVDTYIAYLSSLRDRFNWPDINEDSYKELV